MSFVKHDALTSVHQAVTTTASPTFLGVTAESLSGQHLALITASSYSSDARPNICQMYVQGASYGVPYAIESYSSVVVPQFLMGACAGTPAEPKATLSGQRLGIWNINSYNSTTGWVATGTFSFAASQPVTSVARGTHFELATISTDSTTYGRRFMIDPGGQVVVGNNVGTYMDSPTGKAQLDVRGTLAVGETTTTYFALTSIGSLQYMGVTTAIITAEVNNQMTMSQTTTGLEFRVQGNDGIWRLATLALVS